MATKICDTEYPGLQLEAQLCFKLYSAYSRFFGRFDRLLRAHNLNFTEYIILLTVWDEGPVEATLESLELRPTLNSARPGFLCDSGLPEADWKMLGAQLDKMSDALAQIGLEGFDFAASAVRRDT